MTRMLGCARRRTSMIGALAVVVTSLTTVPLLAQAKIPGHETSAHRVTHKQVKPRAHRRAQHGTHGYKSAHAVSRYKDRTPPSPPGNLTATAGNQQVSLTWQASSDNVGVAGYRVYRDNSQIATLTSTSYADTGLTDGTTYSYSVVAYDKAGNVSASSNTVTARPADSVPPTVPSNLSAVPGDGQVAVSWAAATDSGDAVAGYRIFRNGSQVAQTTSPSFTDSGLTDGVSYTYDVVAYDISGNDSSSSATVSATPIRQAATPPSTPQYLTGVPGDTKVDLSWQASSAALGVAGYEVYRNGVALASTTGTTYTDSGLTDGTSYTYTVTAYDGSGTTSPASNAISLIPTSYNPSGQQLTVGDMPGWHQVFDDNFAGDSLPVGSFSGCQTSTTLLTSNCSGLAGSPAYNKWWAYPDGWGDGNVGTYYPSQTVSVQNGIMNYYIHTASVNGTSYHMIDSLEPKIQGGSGSGGGLLYGRYVVRARIDPIAGYHTAFLLWPDSGVWPRDGEIDFPEADFNATSISAFMHWQNAASGSTADGFNLAATFNTWHTYEIDWTPSRCSFYLDGVLVGAATDVSNIPNTAMHWVLETNTLASTATGATAAGNVQIAWVAAYAQS